MKKSRSAVHYNEDIRNLTISMFLKGHNHGEIDKALKKKVAGFQMKKRGNK